MEAVKKLSETFYQHCGNFRNEAREIFDRIDVNKDGKLELHEFLAFMNNNRGYEHLADRQLFKDLDEDCDGFLGFGELQVVYYMKLSGLKGCEGCKEVMLGAVYYTCIKCVAKNSRFSVCANCFSANRYFHYCNGDGDSRGSFRDNYQLVESILNRSEAGTMSERIAPAGAAAPSNEVSGKKYEELREIAQALFHRASKEARDNAYTFFTLMDENGDGGVDLQEFLSFMRDQGCPFMANAAHFKLFDKDGNGRLDFMEAVTLIYMVGSNRPICRGCGELVPGTFFSCLDCYKSGFNKASFDLCFDCYRNGRFDHKHGDGSDFLDNYSLLESLRRMCQNNQPQSPVHAQATPSESYVTIEEFPPTPTWSQPPQYTYPASWPPNGQPSPPTAIVPYNPPARPTAVFQALNAALSAASFISTMAGCVIL